MKITKVEKITKDTDFCVCSDTDSTFFSAIPIMSSIGIDLDAMDTTEASNKVIELATQLQHLINKSYKFYAEKFHNCKQPALEIKQELISRRGIWFNVKKRYAQWIVNEEGVPVNKLDVKGMDSVRSDFPAIFRETMKIILERILNDALKEEIDDIILDLKTKIRTSTLEDVMIPTGVKSISEYDKDRSLFKFHKATPIYYKAALAYNDFLDFNNIHSYRKLADGDKLLYAHLSRNEYGLETIALSREENPKLLIEFIEKYIDRDMIFNNQLYGKLQGFYDVLGWGKITLNKNVESFFNF